MDSEKCEKCDKVGNRNHEACVTRAEIGNMCSAKYTHYKHGGTTAIGRKQTIHRGECGIFLLACGQDLVTYISFSLTGLPQQTTRLYNCYVSAERFNYCIISSLTSQRVGRAVRKLGFVQHLNNMRLDLHTGRWVRSVPNKSEKIFKIYSFLTNSIKLDSYFIVDHSSIS